MDQKLPRGLSQIFSEGRMTSVDSLIRESVEDDTIFNMGRLLVLFLIFEGIFPEDSINLDRIAYYDFFASQPFLIFHDDKRAKIELLYYGFEASTVGYISSSQRFTTRRERLKIYLSGLLMRNLIQVKNLEGRYTYSITTRGKEVASKFRSMYIEAYKSSAVLTIKKIYRLSDKKLELQAKEWLRAEPFMIELYDY